MDSFKNLEGKPERESPKRTISADGGLGYYKHIVHKSVEVDLMQIKCATRIHDIHDLLPRLL